jgi:hypothetical protein
MSVGRENAKLFQLGISSLLALLVSSSDVDKPLRLYRREVRSFLSDPILFIKSRSQLCDKLLHTLSWTGGDADLYALLPEFKKTPLTRDFLEFLRTDSSLILKFIVSYLLHLKKIDYVDESLYQISYEKWLACEEKLSGMEFDEDLTHDLGMIVAEILDPPLEDVFLGHFGPGFTAEGFKDPRDKFEYLSLDPLTAYAFRGRIRISVKQDKDRHIGRGAFVPKDVGTSRSIVMEPNGRMYTQQDVLHSLRRSFSSSLISEFVSLDHQEFNQLLAFSGSAGAPYDTLDLSSASDLVHIDLVRAIFPRRWLIAFLGCRTSHVKFGDEVHHLRKFAPMGSALCFPVQCVVFTAITLLGLMQSLGYTRKRGDVTKDSLRLFFRKVLRKSILKPRIYGDDIICNSNATDNIIHLLEELGFVVNVNKSFTGLDTVRESCGVYAYKGFDITPLRFRVSNFIQKLDAKSFSSLLGYINRAGDFGYRGVHSLYIWLLSNELSVERFRAPVNRWLNFTDDPDAFGIYTKNPHHPSIERYNSAYQREEKLVFVMTDVVTNRRTPDGYDDYLYDEWVRSVEFRTEEATTKALRRVYPSTTRIRTGWTPF